MKLKINNLSKKFGAHTALEPFNLEVQNCQSIFLIGPSGSGKSTLLRILAGLMAPTSGSISIDDELIPVDEDGLKIYRKSLGVVFQSFNLFPHLTALENIILPLHRVHGVSIDEAHERSLSLLKRFELDKHAHRKPFALSGGQVQRIALIRAVACQPKMLLLDEPTSALDPLMAAEVLELVLELKKEQRNLIFVTHQLHFAKKAADLVLFISDGKLVEYGSSDSLFNNPQHPEVQYYMTKVLH